MQEHVKSAVTQAPILFPFEPLQYWETIRQIIREEVNNAEPNKQAPFSFETPGLTNKPIYKIAEVCKLFQVTKPTIYDWVRHGKLKPFKIQSRAGYVVYKTRCYMHNTNNFFH